MTPEVIDAQLALLTPARRTGFVTRTMGGRVDATGPLSKIGDLCEINGEGAPPILAEVISVQDDYIRLSPLDDTTPIVPGSLVSATLLGGTARVGAAYSGRACNALGDAIDDGPPLFHDALAPLNGRVLAPMDRANETDALVTGVRAIDGLLTLGKGQRIGIFSASGVGKTSLIRQIASQTECDRCVLCLVGERGREVEDLWRTLSRQSLGRVSIVAATSDLSPALRIRAVQQAACLAEYWRDKGEHVLFIVDSVTRYAMALRELGLSAGAPPTVRAYTPNVFAALPRLVERCGGAKAGGCISAVFTVLSETDEIDDPIVEVMKSLLDGHILLSRTLAEQSQFPAIDVVRSVSRQSERLMSPSHARNARRVLSLLATYDEARMMIESGVYRAGAQKAIDDAVLHRPAILSFLRQSPHERVSLAETASLLDRLAPGAHHV